MLFSIQIGKQPASTQPKILIVRRGSNLIPRFHLSLKYESGLDGPGRLDPIFNGSEGQQ